jgi:hypothetical protein
VPDNPALGSGNIAHLKQKEYNGQHHLFLLIFMKDKSILLLAAAIIVASLIVSFSLFFSRAGVGMMGYGNVEYTARPGMMLWTRGQFTGNENGNTMMPWQNCLSSGGTVTNNACVCPTDYTLEEGICVDAMGVPGGAMKQQVQQAQAALMNCQESGGTYANSKCSCPATYTFQQGKCLDAKGNPGSPR